MNFHVLYPYIVQTRSKYRKASRNLSIITSGNDDFDVDGVNEDSDEQKSILLAVNTTTTSEGFIDMIKSIYCVKTMLIMAYCFPTCTLIYYGLSYDCATLPGSLYLNNFLNGLVELVAYLITAYMMEKLARRPMTAGFYFVSGVTMASCGYLFQMGKANIARYVSFIGKFAVSCVYGLVYVYVAELYPTSIRAQGTSAACMTAEIGSFIAPYLIRLGETWLSYTIFAVFATGASMLSLLLAETHGVTMPGTLAELKLKK